MGPVLFLALAQRLAAVTGQGPGLVHVGSQGVAKWPGCHRPQRGQQGGLEPGHLAGLRLPTEPTMSYTADASAQHRLGVRTGGGTAGG